MKLSKKKPVNKNDEVLKEIDESIKEKREEISKLQEEINQLEKERLETLIYPFKIGDYALAEVPYGAKGKKWLECLLECERGTLYLRPRNSDGTLYKIHYSCTPVNKSYSEVLKKLEDL